MKKRHRRCSEDDIAILFVALTAVIFVVIITAIFLLTQIVTVIELDITIGPASQPKPLETCPENPSMHNIVYEETWMYEDEIEKKRAAEAEALRKEELLYLQKITYAEAQGESMLGKILVAASVVNRVDHPDFPDNIKDVLEQTSQYASISWITEKYIANMVSWQKKAWDECRVAAERALAGEDPAAMFLGGPTLYFYNPDPSKCEADELEKRVGIKTYSEGNHRFHHEGPRED